MPQSRQNGCSPFGDGRAEGKAEMRRSLGRQGRQSRREWPISACRCLPLHDSDLGLHLFTTRTTSLSESRNAASTKRAISSQVDRIRCRRTKKDVLSSYETWLSYARGPPRLDAGHDGHRASNLWPQRCDGRAPRGNASGDRRFATTAIAASSPCIRLVLGFEHSISRTSRIPSRTARATRLTRI